MTEDISRLIDAPDNNKISIELHSLTELRHQTETNIYSYTTAHVQSTYHQMSVHLQALESVQTSDQVPGNYTQQ